MADTNDYTQPPTPSPPPTPEIGGPGFSPGELPRTGDDFDAAIVGGVLLIVLGLCLLARFAWERSPWR